MRDRNQSDPLTVVYMDDDMEDFAEWEEYIEDMPEDLDMDAIDRDMETLYSVGVIPTINHQ